MPDFKPITRKEKYLDAIVTGQTGNLPTPITREEMYLNAIATADSSANIPMPVTRIDKLQNEIFENTIACGGITPSGTKEINIDYGTEKTENVARYENVHVVASSPLGDKAITITQNGKFEFDVTDYSRVIFESAVSPTDANNKLNEFLLGTIESIYIPSGVETIKKYLCDSMQYLKSVYMGDDIKIIDDNAFNKCNALQLNVLPPNITRIGNSSFNESSVSINVIPDSVTEIGNSCFRGCNNITQIRLSNKLVSIGIYAFQICYNLNTVIFTCKPNIIYGYTFASTPNLKFIYVPWKYGEVENAPWGATNAEIIYNYTGSDEVNDN